MFLRCYQRQIRPLPDGNGLILSTYSIQLPVTILSTQQVGLYLFSRYGQIIMTFLEAGKTDWVLRFQLLFKQPPTAKVIETFPFFKELDSTLMDQFFLNRCSICLAGIRKLVPSTCTYLVYVTDCLCRIIQIQFTLSQ